MEQLAMLYEEANSIFSYRDGEPPSKRAYDYLCRSNVVKPYEETAMQCAVKHLIGAAWNIAGGVLLQMSFPVRATLSTSSSKRSTSSCRRKKAMSDG